MRDLLIYALFLVDPRRPVYMREHLPTGLSSNVYIGDIYFIIRLITKQYIHYNKF